MSVEECIEKRVKSYVKEMNIKTNIMVNILWLTIVKLIIYFYFNIILLLSQYEFMEFKFNNTKRICNELTQVFEIEEMFWWPWL